jgi:phage terminase large subunit
VDALLHRKGMMGNNQDKSATIQTMMRDAGRKVSVGPKLGKSDRIRFVRSKFPQCRFDAEKCAEGIQALKAYQWDRDEEKPGEPKPLHNFASHPADAFMEACVSVKDTVKRVLPVAHTGRAGVEL